MSTSMASQNNSFTDTLPQYNPSTPTAHKFTGVAESTNGYNSLSILLSANYPVIIRVYQAQSNVGVWNDIQIFNYPNIDAPSGIAIYRTVMVRTTWFKVEVENVSANDTVINLETMKINSTTGTNNYITVNSLGIPRNSYIGITGAVGVSGLYNGLVGVTGEFNATLTVPPGTSIGITGMVGVSGFYNGLVGVTGSSAITVPADTYIGITGLIGVSGFYNGLVGVTGSSAITVPADTYIGITGLIGVSGYYNGLVGVTGSSAITVPADTYIGITGIVGVTLLSPVGITGMVGISGMYNGLVGVTGSSVITVPANTFIGITGMVGVSGFYNGLVGVTGSSAITVPADTYIGITGVVNVVGTDGTSANKIYTDVCGVQRTEIIQKYKPTPYKLLLETDAENIITDTNNASGTLYADWSLDPRGRLGWYTDNYNTEYNIQWYTNPGNFNYIDNLELWMLVSFKYTVNGAVADMSAASLIVNSTDSEAKTADTKYEYFDEGVEVLYPDVPYLFYYGNKPPQIYSSYKSFKLVPDGDIPVSSSVNNIKIRKPVSDTANSILIISAGFWDNVTQQGYSVDFTSNIPQVNNNYTWAGITGLVGVTGVNFPSYLGITGMVGVTLFAPVLVAGNDSTGTARTIYTDVNGLVGVTGSSAITVPANTYIGITGMVGVSGAYNGLVGVTGSAEITVPANTYIGITGLVGISGFYNGFLGITGSATVSGKDYTGNTNSVYVDSCGVQLTQIAKTDTNTVKYNFYTDLNFMVDDTSKPYWSLDSDKINDGWNYNSTNAQQFTAGKITFYGATGIVYNQPQFYANDDIAIWAVLSCKNTSSLAFNKITAPIIYALTSSVGLPGSTAPVTAGYISYTVPFGVSLYNGVNYLFYYGDKARDLNPSYTAILLTRTVIQSTTNVVNPKITSIYVKLGGEELTAVTTKYIVKSAGVWNSTANGSFSAEFGPKMSDIQVVGGTDGLLKYPIYTDVCGVQKTTIIDSYKSRPYKFILESDAVNIIITTGSYTNFVIDPRNRDGWYNNFYDNSYNLKWFDISINNALTANPVTNQLFDCSAAQAELWMIVTCMSNVPQSSNNIPLAEAPTMEIITSVGRLTYTASMEEIYNNIPYLFYYGNTPPMIQPTYKAVLMKRSLTQLAAPQPALSPADKIKTISIIKPVSTGSQTSYLFDSAGLWNPNSKQEFSVEFRSRSTLTNKTMAYNLAYNETTSVYTPVNCSNVSNISYPTTTALHVNPIKPIKTLLKNIYSSSAPIPAGTGLLTTTLLDSSSRKQFGKNCILYYKDNPNPSSNNGVYATGDIMLLGVSGSFEVPLVLNANPVLVPGQGHRFWSSTIDLSPFDYLVYFNLSSVAVTVIYIGIATGNAGCY